MNFIKNALRTCRVNSLCQASFKERNVPALKFHTLMGQNRNMLKTMSLEKSEFFLSPNVYSVIHFKNLMIKDKVKKLCRDCYFLWKNERVYVYCKSHPSHNQATKVPRDKDRFIITHETRNCRRPW